MKKGVLVLIIAIVFIQESCDNEVACTEIFGTIGITVTGDSLTNYYSLRESNNDTIRIPYPYQTVKGLFYGVLDDSYHPKIKNNSAAFRFIGEINDSIVINEPFIIEGDDCHINKVSGKSEIQL